MFEGSELAGNLVRVLFPFKIAVEAPEKASAFDGDLNPPSPFNVLERFHFLFNPASIVDEKIFRYVPL